MPWNVGWLSADILDRVLILLFVKITLINENLVYK